MAYKTKYFNMRKAKLEYDANGKPYLLITKNYNDEAKGVKEKRISLQYIKDAITSCDAYEDKTGQKALRLDEWLDLLAKCHSLEIF